MPPAPSSRSTAVLGTRVGRRLIALFLGCALIPLAVFGYVAFTQVTASLHGEMERSLHASAKAAGMDLAARLLSLRDELDIAAEMLQRPGSTLAEVPAAMREELHQLFSSIERVRGTNVQTELGTARPFAPLSPAELEHLASGHTLARTIHSRTGASILLVRRLVPTAAADSELLAAEIRRDRLIDLEGLRGSGTEVLVLAEEQGGDPSASPLAVLGTSLAHVPDLTPMIDLLGASQSAATFQWQVGGEAHTGHYWRAFLRPQLGMDWFVVQSRARQSSEQSLATFRQTFLLTALLTFLLVAAASLAQIRRTIVPIRQLLSTTQRVTGGELEARAGLEGKDEFAQLGQSFDAMTEQLVDNIRRRELGEVDLIAARDAALAAVRAKAEFLTNVSHELRTPLTSIVSSAEILRDFGDEDPVTRGEFLGIVVDQAGRLQHLIEGVLALHDEDQLAFIPVDLPAALHAAMSGLPDAAQARIAVRVDDPLSQVPGSPDRLAYALRHLLDNAAKFSPPASPIEVRIHRRGDSCMIDVVDHGIGIAEADRERIFEPFCQLNGNLLTAKSTGIGLGLTLVRSIVTGHGGRVVVNATPGQGTTIRLVLPIANASLAVAPTERLAATDHQLA